MRIIAEVVRYLLFIPVQLAGYYVIIIIVLVIVALVSIYDKQIVHWLQPTAEKIREYVASAVPCTPIPFTIEGHLAWPGHIPPLAMILCLN